MIRWYDWVLAFIIADLLMTVFLYTLSTEIWYMSLIGSISFIALYDTWKHYCEFRKELESRK
jgi:hypothetical protein